MKKSTKITGIVALILMLIGGIVALVCLVLGADIDDLKFYVDVPFWQENEMVPEDDFYTIEDSDDVEVWNFNNQQVMGLDLDIEAGTLVLQYSTEEECSVSVEHGRNGLRCEVNNHVLTIEENDSIHTLLNWGKEIPRIIVTLPASVVDAELLQNVRITVGAGDVTAKVLVAKSLLIDVDAGNVYCEGLLVRGQCDIDVSAGNVTINNGNVKDDLQIDVDAGQVIYGGCLYGNWQVDVDAGSVTMDLDHSLEDFDYQIQYDLGSVQLGDKNFDGLSDEINLEYGAANHAQIQCDVGQVKVIFSR